MNVVIGSDHGGYDLKKFLLSRLRGDGYQVDDVGTHSLDSVDYPDFADQVCKKVKAQPDTLGILICGTGVGMSISANRNYEIRAALCNDEYSARMSREHNDANVLCLGARVVGKGLAAAIVDIWLQSSFSGGRHQRRVDKFSR